MPRKINIRMLYAKGIGIFILSFLIFYVVDGIPRMPYLFIALLSLFVVSLYYYKSPRTLLAFVAYHIINGAGFVAAYFFLHQGFDIDFMDGFLRGLCYYAPNFAIELTQAYFFCLTAISLYSVLSIGIKAWKRWIRQSKPTLLPTQEYTLDRLKEYLESFDTIGLCGSWGSGKTFLVNEFMRRNDAGSSKYRFINIEVLSCNLDEIQDIILHEIDKILLNCGIFSQYSKRFNDILGRTGWWSKFRPLIMGDASSFTRTLKSIGDEIRESGKTIVIIFEDIERITEKKMIQKVFGISALISCRHIKIIYQCDMDVLKNGENGHRFSQKELEKYIPHTINMPAIDFADAVECLLDRDADIEAQIIEIARNKKVTVNDLRKKHIKLPPWYFGKIRVGSILLRRVIKKGGLVTKEKLMDLIEISKSDFAYISDDTINFKFGDNDKDVFPGYPVQIDLSRATMRTIKNFLREAIRHLSAASRDIKRTVITTILVKHFYNSIYAIFEMNRSKRFRLLDNLAFAEDTGDPHTISKLIQHRESNKLSDNEVKGWLRHKSKLSIQMSEVLRLYDHNHASHTNSLGAKPYASNEMKDIAIANILYSGAQEMIISDALLTSIRSPILTHGFWFSIIRYDRTLEDFCDSSAELKRSPVYTKLGPHVAIFRAFFMSNNNPNDWGLLIRFYSTIVVDSEPKYIDLYVLLDMLKWCRIDEPFHDLYPHVFELFCNIAARVKNPDLPDSYFDFLRRILEEVRFHIITEPHKQKIDVKLLNQHNIGGVYKILNSIAWWISNKENVEIFKSGKDFDLPRFQRFISANMQLISANMKLIRRSRKSAEGEIEHAPLTHDEDE